MSSKVVYKQTHIDIKDISPKLLSQQIKINGWN
jgi:hypothetical protein